MNIDETRLAIITGAACRIGRALALTLAKRGYAILLHYFHSEQEAKNTAQEIIDLGVPVYLIKADLTNSDDLDKMFTELDTIPAKLQVLVNSASIMQKKDLHNTSLEDWDASFSLNLRAPYFLSQKVVERMKLNGIIVNITDVGANKLWLNYPAYVVSKSALETLTRLQARAYGPAIRVNAIAPGLVLPSENVTENEWNTIIERLPLRHSTFLDDVCSALIFLIDNPSITGQTIVVDGGYSLV